MIGLVDGGWMHGWMHGCGGWCSDGWMGGWRMGGWMNARIGSGIIGWVDEGCIDAWIDA